MSEDEREAQAHLREQRSPKIQLDDLQVEVFHSLFDDELVVQIDSEDADSLRVQIGTTVIYEGDIDDVGEPTVDNTRPDIARIVLCDRITHRILWFGPLVLQEEVVKVCYEINDLVNRWNSAQSRLFELVDMDVLQLGEANSAQRRLDAENNRQFTARGLPIPEGALSSEIYWTYTREQWLTEENEDE